MGEQKTKTNEEATIEIILNSDIPNEDKVLLVSYVKPKGFVLYFPGNVSKVTIEKSQQRDHYIITTNFTDGCADKYEGNFIQGQFNYDGQHFAQFSNGSNEFEIFRDSRRVYAEYTDSEGNTERYYHNEKGALMKWNQIEKLSNEQELERQKVLALYTLQTQTTSLPRGNQVREDYRKKFEKELTEKIQKLPNDREVRVDTCAGWNEKDIMQFVQEYAKSEDFTLVKRTWNLDNSGWILKL